MFKPPIFPFTEVTFQSASESNFQVFPADRDLFRQNVLMAGQVHSAVLPYCLIPQSPEGKPQVYLPVSTPLFPASRYSGESGRKGVVGT